MGKTVLSKKTKVNSAIKKGKVQSKTGLYRTGGLLLQDIPKVGGKPLRWHERSIIHSDNVINYGELELHQLMENIPQGPAYNQRQGQRLFAKQIDIKLCAQWSSGAVSQTEKAASDLYWYVVRDSQANGAQPAVDEIFTTDDQTSAMINIENRKRFEILGSGKQELRSNSCRYSAVKCMDISIPLKFTTNYNESNTSGAITGIRDNAIYIIWGIASNYRGTGTDGAHMTMASRFYYTS